MKEAIGRPLTPEMRTEMLNNRREITHPQGTVVCKEDTDTVGFGVKWMIHTLIRTFEESPGSNTLYSEGTLIAYEPGNFKTHIIRRSLSGDEVNTIGRLCVKLADSFLISEFLPKTIEKTEELISNLGIIVDKDKECQSLTKTVKDLGVALDTLNAKNHEKKGNFRDITSKLDELGVSLVEYRLPGHDCNCPIKLIIDKDQSSKSTQSQDPAEQKQDLNNVLYPAQVMQLMGKQKQNEELKSLPKEDSLAVLFQELGIKNMTTSARVYKINWDIIGLKELENLILNSGHLYPDSKISLWHATKAPEIVRTDTYNGLTVHGGGGYYVDSGIVNHPFVEVKDGTRYTFIAAKFDNGIFRISTTVESKNGTSTKPVLTVPQLRSMLAEKLST